MLCIVCNKETPDEQTYCCHCGAKLDFTFDQITTQLSKDIKRERKQETEAFFRWLLILVLFFVFTGWLFRRIWIVPPNPNFLPGFIPTLHTPKTWHEIQKPLIIQQEK